MAWRARRRTICVLGLATVTVAIAFLRRPKSFRPRATVTVLGYAWTNRISYTIWHRPPEPGQPQELTLIEPRRSPPPHGRVETNNQTLLVRVRLSNSGSQTFLWSPGESGCAIRRLEEWETCYPPHNTSVTGPLAPGKSATLIVALPPDTKDWRFEFFAERYSISRRLHDSLLQFGNTAGISTEISFRLAKMVPGGSFGENDESWLKSAPFEVGIAPTSGPVSVAPFFPK